MTNYLTINDFKSADLQNACRRADKNNSGGIDTDSEFKELINSIHSDNPKNFRPQGHKYQGSESELKLVQEAYDKYKNDTSEKFFKEYKDFIRKNKDLEKIFGKSITNIPTEPDKRLLEPPVDNRGLLPMVPDKSNDFSFDQTKNVDKSNDKIFTIPTTKRFIPLNSDLGKQIGRVTKEFRLEVDGKYEPVYSEPDALGRKEIIGYTPRNIFDIWY